MNFGNLSAPLQIQILQKRFSKFNPGVDPEEVDWEGTLDKHLAFDENVKGFEAEYPQFQWREDEDPYFFQALQGLEEGADHYGLDLVDRNSVRRLELKNDHLRKENGHLKIELLKKNSFTKNVKNDGIVMEKELDRILNDLEQKPLVVIGLPRHGKTTAVRFILNTIRQRKPGWIIRIFDASQAWYHNAPVKYRVCLSPGDLEAPPIISDVVYEMGLLSQEERKSFVAKVIEQDYQERYQAKLEGRMNCEPRSLFVFEEAGTYFDSTSFNGKDHTGDVLRDFIMMGGNYNISSILINQVESGEIATKVRKRATHLIGRVTGKSELSTLKTVTSAEVVDAAKVIPRFHWIYYSGGAGEPFTVPDLVEDVPEDWVKPEPTVESVDVPTPSHWNWMGQFLKAFVVFFMLGLLALGLWYNLFRGFLDLLYLFFCPS